MQWSLEDIYKKQVRGNIPPRKHLRVLGEQMSVGSWSVGGEGETSTSSGEGDFLKIISTGDPEEIAAALVHMSPEEIKQLEMEKKIDRAMAEQMLKAKDHCKSKPDYEAWLNCAGSLLGKVTTHRIDDVLRDYLTEKGWGVSSAKYAQELSRLIDAGVFGEDIFKLNTDEFYNFITGAKAPDFAPGSAHGNFFTDLQQEIGKINIKDLFAKELMEHKSTDAKIRNIGMGELALTIFFKNLRAAKGKGDLEMDGGEFEIKGHGAALGPTGDTIKINLYKIIEKPLEKGGLGIGSKQVMSKKDKTKVTKTVPVVGDKEYDKSSDFAEAIADAYKVALKMGKEEMFSDNLWKVIMVNYNDPEFDKKAVREIYDLIDLKNPDAVNSGIALMNFVRYTSKEKDIGHFMAHDFGASTGNEDKPPPPSDPANLGYYVYVSGSPVEMAKELSKAGNKVGFEKIKINDLRPRIGLTMYSGKPYYVSPVPLEGGSK